MKVINNRFTELFARFDQLEANLRETLKNTSADVKANTSELESLSVMMRQSHPDGYDHHERKPPPAHSSQDLLRRLKRGYLLQYECASDIDDEIGVSRSASHHAKTFDMLKREVGCFLGSPPPFPRNFQPM